MNSGKSNGYKTSYKRKTCSGLNQQQRNLIHFKARNSQEAKKEKKFCNNLTVKIVV